MSSTGSGNEWSRGALLRYGAFSLPLAMAALPLYVHLPKLYGVEVGISLGLLGVVLLATRILDAFTDPIIGWWVDTRGQAHRWVGLAAPVLALGMAGLLMPPQLSASVGSAWLLGWLALWLVVTYAAFSLATISYQAWGAQLSADYDQRTRITAYRESLTLAGVMIAAVLPEAFGGISARGLAAFAIVFSVLIVLAAFITVRFGPRATPRHGVRPVPLRVALRHALANRSFRWLLGVFVFSGIAAAIPSTLFLFFVDDVLQASSLAGVFLLLYFGSGAVGMALWVRLAQRYGKRGAWLIGMVCAVAAFAWAYALGPGEVIGYGVVCVLSGFALGADLALPASLLADVIDRDPRGRGNAEGSYFGLWTFVTKANLALAAGIALPLVTALGYAPGTAGDTSGLSFVYCLVPCALKLIAALVLALWPLAQGRHGEPADSSSTDSSSTDSSSTDSSSTDSSSTDSSSTLRSPAP